MLLARRGFLTGLASLLAAPAVVHAGNLMPVRSIERLLLKPLGWDSIAQPPSDWLYQWMPSDLARWAVDGPFPRYVKGGWEPVDASLYNKEFDIIGDMIRIGNCTLMQRPAKAVIDARQKEIDAAHKLVSDFKLKFGDDTVRVTSDVDYFTTISWS